MSRVYKPSGITTPQTGTSQSPAGKRCSTCANNYLGLRYPELIKPRKKRRPLTGSDGERAFISAPQDLHKESEAAALRQFLGTEETISTDALDANGGFLNDPHEKDAVISDELNHASDHDGIRSAKRTLSLQAQPTGHLERNSKKASGRVLN